MTEKKIVYIRFGVIALMILFAAFSRLLPHPSNFAPIGAMALFGAAYFTQWYLSFLIPIVSMWLSDLVLNNVIYGKFFDHFVWFYPGCYWTYGVFALISIIGFLILKRVTIKKLVLSSLLASILFFTISNFGVWFSTTMYPHNFDGLISCYIAGLPFFKNTVIGDFVYSAVLFGVFEYIRLKSPMFRLQKI